MAGVQSTPSKAMSSHVGVESSKSSPRSSLASSNETKTTITIRIQCPSKTGNDVVDDEKNSLFRQKVSLIEEIIDDDSHVLPLWSKLMDRKRKAQESVNCVINAEVFMKSSGTLEKLIGVSSVQRRMHSM